MTELTDRTLRPIIDNLHTAVMILDASLSVVKLNPSAEMLFHISDARAHGHHVNQLTVDEYEFYDRLRRSQESQHPYSVFDEQLWLHTGEVIDIDYVVSPIDLFEDETSLLVEFIPKSRNKRIAQEQAMLNQQEASRHLLRGLAHEVKNPLGGLRGAAQLLERQLSSQEEKEFTTIIIKEADRLQSLVDRMLGPRTVPDKAALNIHKVLEHVRQLVSAESPSIRFIADYDPSMPDIKADESMMIQSVLNITRNAVSAVGGDGMITYRTRTVRQHAIGERIWPLVARVEIIDDGDGIPDEIKEQIFLPMITGRAEGTGLGLSIAQSLINQHGGLIECDNTEQTVFTILLPIENGHD